MGRIFQPPEGLTDAVDAALTLRRPLLITGLAGSGKSTVIESVSEELRLGRVLRWHITSRSTLVDGLYRYDVLGRIHAQQLGRHSDDIAPFLELGPLGTALLPSLRPRALLIDEIDKADLDLPSDLLDVFERGEYEIPELARYEEEVVRVREWNSDVTESVHRGRVTCTEFPFVIMTSNGERDFPAPFLRRCIRYTMPIPGADELSRIVQAHLGISYRDGGAVSGLVDAFLGRLRRGDQLAIDQLLNAVFIVTRDMEGAHLDRERILDLVLAELSGV